MKATPHRRVTKAIIPAAGMGTRLLPATKSQPKEMLPVGRKPVIQYVVEEIVAAGVHQVLVVTSQQKRAIEAHFDPDPALEDRLKNGHYSLDVLRHVEMDVQLFYTRQSIPRGLADAIARAEHFVDGAAFLVCLGDSILRAPTTGAALRRLIETHEREKAAATVLFETVAREEVVRYGIAAPEGAPGPAFRCAGLVEKPAVDEAPSTLAVAGRYVFEPVVFDYIRKTPPGRGGEIQITDSMRLMIEDGLPVWGVRMESDEHRLDIGNYKSYFRAFFDLSLADPEFGDDFRAYVHERLRETEG